MLLNCLLLEIFIHDQKCIWKIIRTLFTSSTSFPLPSSLHLPLSPTSAPRFLPLIPPNIGFRLFLARFIVRPNPLSFSLLILSPSVLCCFSFGRACCYKESLSDNRVSVKHKVYFLMKNCIQTTREHYFSNLILLWHVSEITWSSSWRKKRYGLHSVTFLSF